MSVKGINVRYVDFLTLPSIFKGTFKVNQNSFGKCKMGILLFEFNWKFELNTTLIFSFSDTFRDE